MEKTGRSILSLALLITVCVSLSLLGARGGADPGLASPLSTITNVSRYLPVLLWQPTLTPTPTLGNGPDLAVNRVEVIQGITMNNSYRVHIANRPATLRVFVSLSRATSLTNVYARLTRTLNGALQPNPLVSGPVTIHAATNEGSLDQTINFALPPAWLVAGTSYALELDPANLIAEASEANNRYPASGAQPFNFVTAEPLQIVLVPIDYQPPSGGRYLPDSSRTDYLDWLPMKVFPVSSITYTWHSPYLWNQHVENDGAGWADLLGAIQELHGTEDPGNTKVYYGVINTYAAHRCPNGCVVGIGYVGWPAAVGFAGWTTTSPGGEKTAGSTLTHEIGHNFNRPHAPCGVKPYDLNYPYPGGSIGKWGLDVSVSKLYDPGIYKDYMSYCSKIWTSDYTYKGIYDFRASRPWEVKGNSAVQDILFLSGWIGEDGEVRAGPLYRHQGIVSDLGAGTHRVELLGEGGVHLGDYRFTPLEIADAPEQALGFSLSLPDVGDIAGLRIYDAQGALAYERVLPGGARGVSSAAPSIGVPVVDRNPDGSVRVGWALQVGAMYRVRFSADGGVSWQVLALDGREASYTVPAEVLVGAEHPVLEVQAVDGLRTATEIVDLAPGTRPLVSPAGDE